MVKVSLVYLLCQSESLIELETTARELGCVDISRRYGAIHMTFPDGTRGSFRESRDPARGIRGNGFVWCGANDAE